jgi:hypothetical protein
VRGRHVGFALVCFGLCLVLVNKLCLSYHVMAPRVTIIVSLNDHSAAKNPEFMAHGYEDVGSSFVR